LRVAGGAGEGIGYFNLFITYNSTKIAKTLQKQSFSLFNKFNKKLTKTQQKALHFFNISLIASISKTYLLTKIQ
jgi:hypothetical protein